jgi:hypothetical protein
MIGSKKLFLPSFVRFVPSWFKKESRPAYFTPDASLTRHFIMISLAVSVGCRQHEADVS